MLKSNPERILDELRHRRMMLELSRQEVTRREEVVTSLEDDYRMERRCIAIEEAVAKGIGWCHSCQSFKTLRDLALIHLRPNGKRPLEICTRLTTICCYCLREFPKSFMIAGSLPPMEAPYSLKVFPRTDLKDAEYIDIPQFIESRFNLPPRKPIF